MVMDQDRKWRRSSSSSSSFLALYVVVLLSFPAGGLPLVASSSINHGGSNYTISDRIALLSFKSLIISGDPHGGLETWKSSSHHTGDLCTTWRGVTCGHRHGRVVSLDLSSLNLTGTISPSIANLTFLRWLDLSDNSLRGSIPDELGSLPRLQHLNLSDNSLEGKIPASLSCCSQLRDISLRNNQISGHIPSTIGRLQQLQVLSLRGNQISGRIPSTLGTLSSLSYLALSENRLEAKDAGDWDFLAALSNCSKLQRLHLSNNLLGGALPSSVGNLSTTQLVVLAMDGNQISGNIPGEIGKLVGLTWLYLSYNLLTGPIPDAIGHLQQLQILSLSDNQISGDIPPFLGNLSILSKLFLDDNTLIGGIPSTLWHLSSLTILELSGNNLTGGIPPSRGNFSTSLTELDLAQNSLTGVIPPTIGSLHIITHLFLDSNNLAGTVPQSLWNLSNLVQLDLGSNQLLTGTLPLDLGHTLPKLSFLSLGGNKFHGRIPISLSNASSLKVIQIGGNLFSGTIPPSLGNLPSLTKLNLIGNQLEAKTDRDWDFLAKLSNCTSLKDLELESNKLGGNLPQSVANLSQTLTWLNMKANNISGSMPPGIGNLGLLALELDHNLLTGTIPSTIGKLRKLHVLNLQSNGLSGEIPSTVGNLTELNEFYLNNNYLTGHLPATLGDCGRLRSLNLGNNNLTGAIPNRIVSISSLSNLILGGNSLSGLLPVEVGSLIILVELDLSNNRLSGEIPSTIRACQEIQYLHLQGNNFNGTIPSSFSAGLEVLDLSCNNLSGHIPESLASIRSLIMLNLSFNDLDGEVPKGGAFRNSTAVSLNGNRDLCGGNPELDLPPCFKQRKHRSSRLAIIFSIIGALLCLVAIVFCIVFARRHKYKSRNKQDPSAIQQALENKHIRVSYNELLKATDDFSFANLIGQGSFGSVYKGTMSYHGNQNVNVAVKVLNLQQRGASKSFMAECEALRNIRHRNLLKILTSCSSIDLQGNDFKALVFEYLPNGSLEKWLHCKENDEKNHEKLSLIQRLNIAVDIASALDYLHNKGSIPIVHCDLKPSNVLLDNDMTAHVGDFGLARFLTEYATRSSQRSTSSVILKGSIGYIAPEYGIGNEVSTQGDLYSYGIVILEMFTRRRPTDDGFKEGLNLHRFVEMAFPEQLMRIIDPYLLMGGDVDIHPQGTGVRNRNLECITEVLQIGLSCSNESPMDRMHIEDVVKNMQDIRDVYNRNGTQGKPTNQI